MDADHGASMRRSPDLEGLVSLLSPEQGGRSSPVWQGYRTNHDFGLPEMINTAIYQFHGTPPHPGESRPALLWLLSPELFVRHFQEGMEFAICEGARRIGNLSITKILNRDLAKSDAVP